MALTTSSNVILIAPGAMTGNVTISWDFSPLEIRLEERTYKVGSTAVFQPRPIFDTQLLAGSYTKALAPGDVYEVRAFRRNFVAGTKTSDAEKARHKLGEVVIHALQLPTTLQRGFSEKVGGTFYRYSITTGSAATGPIPTHGILEVGKDPPILSDASGFYTMPNPIMTVPSFTPLVTHHLTTDKLINTLSPQDQLKLTDARHALIRVSDATGQWQQIRREFQALRRSLTITFDTIDAQSLGEGWGETEAQMHFKLEVWDFDGQSWGSGPVRVFEFDNNHTKLTPFPVTNFVPNPVHVVPPRPVRGELAGLAVNVTEYDDWPFNNEHASSLTFGKPSEIKITPGENNENNTILTTVRAYETSDPFDPETEIVVDVRVSIAVAHVP